MGLIPAKTPWLLKRFFSNYIWDVPSTENVLYLTFDDGPTPEITNWVLDTLEAYGAKATFFCIGANVDKYPDIFQNILRREHRIGNHTYNHLRGWKTKTKTYLKNVEDCTTSFKALTDTKQSAVSNLFRPPYGKITFRQGRQLKKLSYKIIMWDVLSFDWNANTSKETCLEYVISKSKPGSIIVFHDSVKSSHNMMYALPKVLEHFSNKGYTFKALT